MARRTRAASQPPTGNNMPVSTRPSFNADDIKAALERYDRTPFIDLLTEMIKWFPDEASLQVLALKKPELYINSLATMARISGYTEKQEVQHIHTINVSKMSDSQLEDHAKALLKEIELQKKEKAAECRPVIEGEVLAPVLAPAPR